ncbi:MAG: NUDIX domain-containing protein [Nanoarchaeota archaeon]
MKKYIPGKTVIPSGHVETGESYEKAMKRELKEELNLIPKEYSYICSLLDRSDEGLLRIHYYVITAYSGEMKKNEAEELKWIQLHDTSALSFEVDCRAIQEYQRIFK